MDVEALPEEVIWQAAVSGHLKWTVEIERRLNVKIEVMFSGYGRVMEHGEIVGEATCVSTAKAEMLQCEDRVEQLYYSIMLLRRDPFRRCMRCREAADLYGRKPWQAIKQAGLECIDVLLVGPAARRCHAGGRPEAFCGREDGRVVRTRSGCLDTSRTQRARTSGRAARRPGN